MGARWYWAAVCPNLHVYSNFSGGADPCYECGRDPEVEFEGDGEDGAPDALVQAETYAQERKTMTPAQMETRSELAELGRLADRHGFRLVKK